jgi:hypothetical protein
MLVAAASAVGEPDLELDLVRDSEAFAAIFSPVKKNARKLFRFF